MVSFSWLVLGFVSTNPGRSSTVSSCGYLHPSAPPARRTTVLHTERKSRADGVYVRPSAAIERGSGFFVPGLEGAKVRIAVGVVLLSLIGVNQVGFLNGGNGSMSAGDEFATGLAVCSAVLVLFQAAIEYVKEQRGLIQSSGGEKQLSITTLRQVWSSPPATNEYKANVEWAAASYSSLTPTTDMLLVGPGKILFSLGGVESFFGSAQEESDACRAALETLSQSSSGRVSLPLSHPAAAALRTKPRTVILQRIGATDNQLFWMVLSDQPLAGFTKQDLRWLGQMAAFVEL